LTDASNPAGAAIPAATRQDPGQIAWWTKNIDELAREIGRLCALCQVRILDAGVVERVLKRDASVCGSANEVAFAKLHDLLMLFFAIRSKSVEAVGQLQTAQIEAHVIEDLRARFATLLGPWPPAWIARP
jgi:hypothetical protein